MLREWNVRKVTDPNKTTPIKVARSLCIIALGLGTLLASSESTLADPWVDECTQCFYANLEPLYMRATSSEADGIWLTMDSEDTLGQPGDDETIDNSGAFHMDYSWGLRGTLGYQFNEDWGVEIVGTYIDDWSDSVAYDQASAEAHTGVVGGRMMVPFQSEFTGIVDSAFTDLEQADATRNMKFRTYEVNAVRRMSKYTSVLVGFRMFDFDDDFLLLTERDGDIGSYAVENKNDALGIQFGANAVFPIGERFAISGFLKTGMFMNDVLVRNDVTDGPAAILAGSAAERSIEDDDSRAAFIADTALFLNFAVTDRVVTSIGYQVMAISGLAMVGDNLEMRTGGFDPIDIFEPIKAKRNGFQFLNGVNFRVKISG